MPINSALWKDLIVAVIIFSLDVIILIKEKKRHLAVFWDLYISFSLCVHVAGPGWIEGDKPLREP